MAYKVTKKEVMEMSKAELLASFELCIVSSVKEDNFEKGVSKQTYKSYELLKNRLLAVMGSDETYNDEYDVVKR